MTMAEQGHVKADNDQKQPDTLTNSELEQIDGGLASAANAEIISPRDPASGLPTGK
jgi:hypothetical protein